MKKEVPRDIHQSVHNRRRKDLACVPSRPTVKNPGDGRENDVAPIRKSEVGNVRKSKKHRRRPPARQVALARSRQYILQQATEEKFFRPGRKKENPQRGKQQRSPCVPL